MYIKIYIKYSYGSNFQQVNRSLQDPLLTKTKCVLLFKAPWFTNDANCRGLATVSAEDRLNNWSQTCTLERGNEVRSLTLHYPLTPEEKSLQTSVILHGTINKLPLNRELATPLL